jgi:riboflavin biosynthesis pyrimidine reductase
VLHDQLAGLADVVSLRPSINFAALLDDLGTRNVHTLMVEGGGSMHTAFLSAGLVDEIHLAAAPIVVGQASAPRFHNPRATRTRPISECNSWKHYPSATWHYCDTSRNNPYRQGGL